MLVHSNQRGASLIPLGAPAGHKGQGSALSLKPLPVSLMYDVFSPFSSVRANITICEETDSICFELIISQK